MTHMIDEVNEITVAKEPVDKVGSCNACTRGKITKDGSLKRPYDIVFEITLHHMVFRLCNYCFHRLKDKMSEGNV